jgi:hypothetical protein
MGINKRIGIIRARNDSAATLIPDADCLQVLMTGNPSLFRYWSDTTEHFFDFIDSPMFPWVDIQLGADISRNTVTRQAIAALRAKFPDPEPMKGLDGLIVLVHPAWSTYPIPMPASRGSRPRCAAASTGAPATRTACRRHALPSWSRTCASWVWLVAANRSKYIISQPPVSGLRAEAAYQAGIID